MHINMELNLHELLSQFYPGANLVTCTSADKEDQYQTTRRQRLILDLHLLVYYS